MSLPLPRRSPFTLSSLVALCVASTPFAVVTTGFAADATWGIVPPFSRAGGLSGAGVYDPDHDRIVVFGGTDFSTYTRRLDQLTLSAAPTWLPLTASGEAPPWGTGVAVYDPSGMQMLVVAPNAPATELGVWSLTLAGTPAWQRLGAAGVAPTAREDFTAVFDAPRGRIIVFGGAVRSQQVNELWAFDLASLAWHEIDAAGQVPAPRQEHVAVFDAASERMVIFGGLSETWALSLRGIPTWQFLATTGPRPDPTATATGVYDATAQRMVVCGARATSGQSIWSLSLGDSPEWTELSTSGPDPSIVGQGILDPVRQRIIVTRSPNSLSALSLSTLEWADLDAANEVPYVFYPIIGYDAIRHQCVV
jgi:hypothetical protein